jgi:hypothetical protein
MFGDFRGKTPPVFPPVKATCLSGSRITDPWIAIHIII